MNGRTCIVLMRTLAAAGFGLALAGCTPEGSLSALTWPEKAQEARQAREAAQQAANDAKCRELGFKPQTEAYGNCRLQLEQIPEGNPFGYESPLNRSTNPFLRMFGLGTTPEAQEAERNRLFQQQTQRAADDAKCRELGFKPQTEAYGNCRLQLEQIRATERKSIAETQRGNSLGQSQPHVISQEGSRKVYSRDECIGPVVMGRCEGTILPKKAYHPTCHGEWLNGQCTGPMF